MVTSRLEIAVEESGSAAGVPVILLHGWPDSPRCWDRLLPTLHQAGFRTITPYLRGNGPTRFRDDSIVRTGQASALAMDAMELADAMGIDWFHLIGHDWGARAAYICACVFPQRVQSCTAISIGWGKVDPAQPPSIEQAQNFWYQWFMGLPQGESMLRNNRNEFTRHIWKIWNPGWEISNEEFSETATSFDNNDWPDVVLHYYRSRWGLAPLDPAYAEIEEKLASSELIDVPTLVLHGAADPCVPASASENKDQLFTNSYRRIVLDGVGHFPQRQAAKEVAAHIKSLICI
mgnify:CR=1 FL=1